MMFDHIDLRVRSLAEASAFYDRLLPALGFMNRDTDGAWVQYTSAPAPGPSAFFGFIESATHRPNETRVAFRVESNAEVDRLAALVRAIGAGRIEGPGFESPDYYAVFFEDPSGNRLEVCHRTRDEPLC
jgi:catechol 2,3-dioxygenase-like lactoylglutathione lyase family enzyme